MTTTRTAAHRRLYNFYKTFTHGGLFWKDNYLLEQWDSCNQRVVHRNDMYHGYKMLRRLGHWCWLTRDPQTGKLLTVKFLARNNQKESNMWRDIRDNCDSPYISKIKDQFMIAHHLPNDSRFKGISFEAIVYPATGSSFERALSRFEGSDSRYLPLSIEQRVAYIRQIVRGIAALHKIGIVHADLHPGNVALAQPSREDIDDFLSKPPLEHSIQRKDGSLTPLHLPQVVCEPEDIGFGLGDVQIFDFGYSFRPVNGASYPAEAFPSGTARPPELITGEKMTTQPFKTDSWYLGQLIYFILTHGCPIFPSILGPASVSEYKHRLMHLREGHNERVNEISKDVAQWLTPYVLGLLDVNPHRRLSVLSLSKDTRFIEANLKLSSSRS